jgi:hypothetical protein
MAAKRCVVRWHLTNDERKRIADGEDLYLFYHGDEVWMNRDHLYSLEIAPEGTANPDTTTDLMITEHAPSGVIVDERFR